uniref:mRNA decay factor PAT1 domain-containing protein n=1 Tax=Lutzomyia longipalpis TaxID=7200 RepID=A0A7G3AKF7_LUTLO
MIRGTLVSRMEPSGRGIQWTLTLPCPRRVFASKWTVSVSTLSWLCAPHAACALDDDDELEYDALNDETFGAAVSTDWEGIHENLVKLESEKKQTNEKPHRAPVENANSSRNKYGADLDVNLSRVSLDDCFLENLDDPELPLKLDSSVWSSPVDHRKRDDPYNALSKPDMSKAPKAPVLNSHSPLPKMFTVEDIERNIRKAQTTPRDALGALGMPLHYAPEPPKPPNLPPPPNQLNCRHIMPPPGILPSPLSQAHNVPLYNVPMAKQQPPPFRPPPSDFPLMHLMTSMGGPPMPRPIPPAGMPQMPYSNMPMHSNFGGVRPPMPGQPGRINPLMNGPPFPTPPPPTSQMQSNPVSVNQYNKRLVQEIQQNHPMLYFNRMNNFDAGNNSYHQNQMNGSKNSNQNHQQQHRFKQQQQHKSDGNLNLEEYDEYANLMSQRNKQWLIGIQLLQLNTETPYIDDYYYTVFKERRMRRERESKAHRDNQMNHPLTQPKGHQQLVLMSMGKNGTNQRNHDRDKKNQDANKGDKEMTPRTYTPLQFENSLGKLQCGSVTAPRKIIDMDIMGPETGYQLNPSIELSTQKKSRQMLLHIESLYKIVLKIEDLKNPIAVSTALVVKAKKERERKQALEQLESEDPADGEGKSRQAVLDAIDEKYPEPEKLDDLLPQLVAGLSVDKVMGMMNVRKGKTLIKRALPHLVDEEHKWQVWQAIFAVLPIITKKDRDDTDGSLGGLFTEFKNHLIVAKLGDFITVPKAIIAASKKLNFIFASKFGMLSIIAMMLRVETIFQMDENEPPLTASNDGTAWGQFVATLAACAAKQPLTEAEQSLDKEILQILLNHLRRYPEIETQPLTTALSQVEFK